MNEDKKIHVLITVDVEAHRGRNPVEEWIYGRYKGEEYGIPKIMDICDQHGVKATFFIDIPEVWIWGEKVMQEVGEKILEKGHDLQLHVHPDHITKEPRLFLWEYNYNEQLEIIKQAANKFEELWGERPIAFRAGKYGANYDTLDILGDINIKEDFSMLYNSRWCGLNDPPLTINRLKRYKGLIEVPVTVFKSFDLFRIRRFDSISLDGTSLYEFRRVFSEIMREGRPKVVVLMLHSFSFIKRDRKGNLKGIRTKVIQRVEKLLGFLAQQQGLSSVTAKELWGIIHDEERGSLFEGKEAIPVIKNRALQYIFTLRRAGRLFGKNSKATGFILLSAGGLIGIGTLIWFFIIHR